ncbi:MAG: M48 family metallopeptidase [Eubacteriales bacterium]|nr:M48 family metallopeptidase [Eubacteriales bacterium]
MPDKTDFVNGFEYKIIKSRRRTYALQISPEGEITVRAPLFATSGSIRRFVSSHSAWISSHLQKLRNSRKTSGATDKLTEQELNALVRKAKQIIPGKTATYASVIGVSYGRISIRHQHTRWGSCSSKGNLNFNCLLMLAPEEVLDSVIVHELCHRKHMDHSPAFYAEVLKAFPDYQKWNKWLKDNGATLQARNP